jgi:hypothetical protein
MRFVGFGLLEQGLHFAPTSGREAHLALAFVVCGVATLDPPGALHAAHRQLGRGKVLRFAPSIY